MKKIILLATQNEHKVFEIKNLFQDWIHSQEAGNSHLSNIRNIQWLAMDSFSSIKGLNIDEDGDSFLANAKIKVYETADALRRHYPNNILPISPNTQGELIGILGEDSGLCVDVLNGDPGIFSARYAEKTGLPFTHKRFPHSFEKKLPRSELDKKNRLALINQLLETSKRMSKENLNIPATWKANFQTDIFFSPFPPYTASMTTLESSGKLEGSIILKEKGTKGFGYDSIFAPLESEEKALIGNLKSSSKKQYYEFGRTLAEMTPLEKNVISHRKRAFFNFLEKLKTQIQD